MPAPLFCWADGNLKVNVMSDQQAVAQDAKIIGLIGLAHGTSHFFHMLLPPLFPWFIKEFSLSYAELGVLVSVFFAVSGLGQAMAGFVVDKVGARPVLFAALSSFFLAALATAAAPGYAGLMLAAALAGLGNASFHPVDFSILNQKVSPKRLGHAFSVHGISGNLGWASAPLFLTGLSALTGSWRLAALGAAVLVLVVVALLFWQRAHLAVAHKAPAKAATTTPEHPLAFLKLPAVWLCFAFFFWSTCALSAVQSFAGTALQQLYGLNLEQVTWLVPGYMLWGAFGMLAGGFLVGRIQQLERTISLCLLAAGGLFFVAGSGWLTGLPALFLAALAGLGSGLAGPSRDMMIRQSTPVGATGRVYGAVYSGLDIGFALAAPVFGALLDHQQPAWVFYGAALVLVLSVVSALGVGGQRAARLASV